MLYVLNFVLAVFLMLLRAVTIKTLWAWFIMAIFAGLSPLSILLAIGLSLFVTAIIPMKSLSLEEFETISNMKPEVKQELMTKNYMTHIIVYISILIVSWVIHMFM